MSPIVSVVQEPFLRGRSLHGIYRNGFESRGFAHLPPDFELPELLHHTSLVWDTNVCAQYPNTQIVAVKAQLRNNRGDNAAFQRTRLLRCVTVLRGQMGLRRWSESTRLE